MKNIVVHIGYPKCASTFIQKKIFSFSGFNYISGLEASPLNMEDFNPDSFKKSILSNKKYNPGSNLTIISYPPLSSPNIDNYNQQYFNNSIKNLKKIHREIKIILVLRNQLSLIKSWYVYSVTRGLNTITYSSFNKWLKSDFRVMNPEYLLNSCIEYIKPKNMLIIPVELLTSNSDVFLKKLSEFMDAELPCIEKRKVNQGYYNYYSILCWRLLNFLFISIQTLIEKNDINTTRGSYWHKNIKHRYLRLKGIINPKIEKYFPRDINLYIPDHKIAEFRSLFSKGNMLANKYSCHSLKDFGYFF